MFRKRAGSQKWIGVPAARDFGTAEKSESPEYFVYSKTTICTDVTKDPALDGKALQEFAPQKREAGRILHSPRFSSRFACERLFRCGCYHASLQLGGQNLAATCTTTGQNLTAVCSCHSLTETVDLGTMTAAGLIGTLHVEYTSCFNYLCSTGPKTRSNT